MAGRFEILKEHAKHPAVRTVVIIWAIISIWDTGGSQLLPPDWASQRPTIYGLLVMTTGWLSLQTWLLIGALLLAVFAIEYPFRHKRKFEETLRNKSLTMSVTGTVTGQNHYPARRKQLLVASIVFVLFVAGTIISGAWLYHTYASGRSNVSNKNPSAGDTPKADQSVQVSPRTAEKSADLIQGTDREEIGSIRILYDRTSGLADVLYKTPNIKIATVERDQNSVTLFGPLLIKIVFHTNYGPFDVSIQDVSNSPFTNFVSPFFSTIENSERFIAFNINPASVMINMSSQTREFRISFFHKS
jgi:hypothetical protein